MLSGAEKYKAKDMGVAATFISDKPLLKVLLAPVAQIKNVDGTVSADRKTGCRVFFKGGRYVCENLAVFKFMMAHKAFERGMLGYNIDPEDPTGFWRAAGVVEEREVKTFVVDSTKNVGDMTIDPKKIAEQIKKIDREFSPLVTMG